MERRKDHPPPSHWQDFEDLCLKLWRPRLIDAKKNGRSGQPQAGVDIFGRDPTTEAWVGIQCKQKGRWPKKVLTVGEIEAEVEQAEGFEPLLSRFIVATTAPRDVEVQRFVRELSDLRRAEGKFSVDLFAWDDLQDWLQEQSQRAAVIEGEPKVSIAKLPVTGEHFVAREEELARLDAAWDDPDTNVISFVALGGIGKSALVNEWLGALQADGWRGAERVLGWSFHSQGTEGAGASSEAFTEYALKWLGYQGEIITSPWEKGEVIARLVRARRTLLVLDGLEPFQYPPGAQTGRIKDPPVQALVKELAAQNPGLCVISTRLAVADVASRAGAEAVDLDRLPPVAGAELLRRLGVEGSGAELRAASEEFGGHGLALSLLGTYLHDVCGGDVRRCQEVPLLDPEIAQGRHARRVMASYETWMGEGPELKVLRLIGLFDRPAEAAALAALRREPAIPGLTGGLTSRDETRWRKAVARLRQARLLDRDDASGGLGAHPLVREHFDERLRDEQPEAWRAGHERLYEHYQQAADERPETLEAMLPLYAAVVHGCRSGRVQEAFDAVYRDRIHRKTEFFSQSKLGAFSAEISTVAAFFERPWDRADPRLTSADQAWILNQAGFVLKALGRLPEAIKPMRAGFEARVVEKNWRQASISAGNCSELLLTLGDVAASIRAGIESVEAADRNGHWDYRVINRAILADNLHQAGRWDESAATFRRAERIQGDGMPLYPRLYSVQGFRYCDFLLSTAELHDGSGLEGLGRSEKVLPYRETCKEVQERANYMRTLPGQSMQLLDLALIELILARAHFGLALVSLPEFTGAAEHLDRALDGLRQADHKEFIARGLLDRAALHRLRAARDDDALADLDATASDLREAQEIAERGHMRLHETDAHLEWTRLRLQTGDRGAAFGHLERARELVTACGYGRREREVVWLSSRLEREGGAR